MIQHRRSGRKNEGFIPRRHRIDGVVLPPPPPRADEAPFRPPPWARSRRGAGRLLGGAFAGLVVLLMLLPTLSLVGRSAGVSIPSAPSARPPDTAVLRPTASPG